RPSLCFTSIHHYPAPRSLPSFPTRRSSDLSRPRTLLWNDSEREPAARPSRPPPRRPLPRGAADPAPRPGDGVRRSPRRRAEAGRSEEHTSELQSRENLVCRLLLEKKKKSEH